MSKFDSAKAAADSCFRLWRDRRIQLIKDVASDFEDSSDRKAHNSEDSNVKISTTPTTTLLDELLQSVQVKTTGVSK